MIVNIEYFVNIALYVGGNGLTICSKDSLIILMILFMIQGWISIWKIILDVVNV